MARLYLALVALLAVASCAPSIDAAMTAKQVVATINDITSQSQALQRPAVSINIINGPLIVIGQGPFPQIIRGFVLIAQTATTAMVRYSGD